MCTLEQSSLPVDDREAFELIALPANRRDVRELLGGYEYGARNGLPVVRDGVVVRDAPDPLVTADA